MTIKPSFRIALFAALVLAFASLPTALAAKGGGHGGTSGISSISLVPLNSSDGLPHYGQGVTFNIATTATSEPYVNLKCFQNGVFAGEAWRGFFPASLTGQIFTLGGSTLWQGGAADCTAYLDKYTKRGWQQLAATSFHVYA